jgi:hypothetical protein
MNSQMASGLTSGGGTEVAVAALTELLALQVNNRLQQAQTKRAIRRWLGRGAGVEKEMNKAILFW